MDNSFNNILFLTSFCCMAIDGEIAKDEYELLQNFSEKENLFGTLKVEDEFDKCVDVLKKMGTSFVKSYLQAVQKIDFSDEEKCQLLDVTVKTIYADKKVEYTEIKFFKSLFNHLNITKDIVLRNVPNVDEYWLDDDMASNTLDYLQDIDFSLIDNKIIEQK